jgi:hypothetical protein
MAPTGDPRSTIEWSLIATLHHRPGRPTAVELAPGAQRVDVDAWSRSEGWCEHCRTRRTRRTTYLLRRRNGSLAQIGSTCLAEFLGDPDPMRVLRPGRRHRSPRQRHDHGDAHRRPSEYVDAQLYLAHVAQAVFDGGFVSSVGATSGRPVTWARALATLDVARSPSSRALRRARQTVEWVRDEVSLRPALDAFERRLVQILGQDRLTLRELPTAAAGIYAYHHHLRRQIEARERSGEFLGEPGEMITASFVVRRVERVATAGGPVHRHFLRDELGRISVWDSQNQTLPRCSNRLEVVVAEQTRLDDRPITVLARCFPASSEAGSP